MGRDRIDRNAERAALLLQHPLLNGYLLQTGPIREMYAQVKFRLVTAGNSCCFGGFPRAGKSTAIALVQRYLRADFPNLPVYVFNVTNTSHTYSLEFLAHWASAVHEEIAGTSYNMRGRIERTLIDAAYSAESNRIVLILDEVQNIRLHELQFLKDIFNSLFCDGIRLITVSVGQQPDLTEHLKDLADKLDLVHRFFGGLRVFRGIRLNDEVKAIFEDIDARRFEQAGQSWSEFFAPHRWRQGWRLKDEPAAFSKALMTCGLAKSIGNETTVSANVFFSALRCYLVLVAERQATGDDWSSDETWVAAMREGDFGLDPGHLSAGGGSDDKKVFRVAS